MKELNELLEKLEGYIEPSGRVPLELFYFISKHFGECCLELCVFKRFGDSIKILLIPRDEKDDFWAGKLHIPGIRKIVTDTEYTSIKRVVSETGLYIPQEDVEYCCSSVVKNYRGTEFSDLRFVEYFGESDKDFYDTKNLPTNIIEFQRPMIESAIECFLEKNK